MNIIVADEAGFCFGVKRAIEIAYREKEKYGDNPIYTFGPLVHNPQVVQKLEMDGIFSIENLNLHPPGRLIIRTHGVSPEIRLEASRLGYDIIDATCPLVKRIHEIVLRLQKEDYPIVIIGNASHPEVQGIMGHVKTESYVIEKNEDVRNLPGFKKLGVVVQTTSLLSMFHKISMQLLKKSSEIRIFNTICNTTIERQASAKKIAEKTDIAIVIGGRDSSNTRQLLEICRNVNPRSYHIESSEQIKREWFEGVTSVSLTAGASTPDYIMQEVYEKIQKLQF